MRMAKRARVCSAATHHHEAYFPMPMTSASLEPIPFSTVDPVCQEKTHEVYAKISPHENDILLGRGGKNNQHVGNEQLRALARTQKEKYRRASKLEKSAISRKLVTHVRSMTPPGRFLKKNALTSHWEDVGDTVAREKVSQVFRDTISADTNTPALANKEKVKSHTLSSSPENKIPEGCIDFLPPKKPISRTNNERVFSRVLMEDKVRTVSLDDFSTLTNSPVQVNKKRRAMQPPMLPTANERPYDYVKPVVPERSYKNSFRPIDLPSDPHFADIIESDLLKCLDAHDMNEFDLFNGDLLGGCR